MTRLASAPLALALFALAACGQSGTGGNASAPAGSVAGKAAPAGTSWADQVVATPEGGFRMGNPDAPIKIVEFGSYTCPHCKDFTEQADGALVRDYISTGKVSFEYRNFIRDPLDMTVALLARCTGPTAFFPLNLQFFQNQSEMITKIQGAGQGTYESAMSAPANQRFVKLAEMSGLIEFAMQRGVPEAQARQCLADIKQAETLAKSVETATAKYNITGTPTIIMNESKLEDVAAWPQLVERLKGAGV
jgi:protein-disulfide isomerase